MLIYIYKYYMIGYNMIFYCIVYDTVCIYIYRVGSHHPLNHLAVGCQIGHWKARDMVSKPVSRQQRVSRLVFK